MPSVTETPTEAYAHCVSPRCSGNNQEQVEALKRETAHSYRENGGDMPGVERSHVRLAFADPEKQACPHCGSPRDLSDQPRKAYAALSGHDPMGLLGAPKFDPQKQQEFRQELQSQGIDPEKQALEEQVRQLGERLAEAEAKEE